MKNDLEIYHYKTCLLLLQMKREDMPAAFIAAGEEAGREDYLIFNDLINE